MQYILTQDELDALKNKPRVNAQEFLNKLGEYILLEKVCLDVTFDPVWVLRHETFKKAVQKTVEYYAKQNS